MDARRGDRPRRYRQVARAVAAEATRTKILDAACALHRTVGPAETTILAVAAAAEVQRLTVYRHFPTPEALDAACAEREDGLHPRPDPARLSAVDPVDRLFDAITAFDAYYLATEPLIGHLVRDAPRHAPSARRLAALVATIDQAVGRLEPGWPPHPDRVPLVRAALRLALGFETWRSLRRVSGLTTDETSDLLVGLVEAAAEPLA